MDFKKIHPDAQLPIRQSKGAAGYDLHATEDALIYARSIVGTGIAVSIPPGHVGMIRDRSGMAANRGITTLAGIIDCDYTGEVKVVLSCVHASGDSIKAGDRIAQLVVVPCVMEESRWVDELQETARGEGGFGSTGVSEVITETQLNDAIETVGDVLSDIAQN